MVVDISLIVIENVEDVVKKVHFEIDEVDKERVVEIAIINLVHEVVEIKHFYLVDFCIVEDVMQGID